MSHVSHVAYKYERERKYRITNILMVQGMDNETTSMHRLWTTLGGRWTVEAYVRSLYDAKKGKSLGLFTSVDEL